MSLIRHGSLDAFAATVVAPESAGLPNLGRLRTFSDVGEAIRAVQPAMLELPASSESRGLALKSLKLTQGFEGFLQNMFNPTNNVYFLAWSWDLSGAPIVEYPGSTATDRTCLVPMKVGQVREFLGAGVALFPARQVTSGLATRIMLWESDQSTRDFGKAMSDVAKTVKVSKLSNLLSVLSLTLGATTTTVTLIKDAVVELADAIGKVLQANSDDYVDFYEGYYPVAEPWTIGDEMHRGNASEIAIARLA